jgi:flagellar basal-body rod protein FlgB
MSDSPLGSGGGLMNALKARMHFHEARQKVLAQNVANADSPGFRPVDLKSPEIGRDRPQPVLLAQTAIGHMTGAGQAGGAFDDTKAKRFETTPSGNAVNLEDEMMKVARNQGDFQLAASLYSKSLGLMKIAIGKGR